MHNSNRKDCIRISEYDQLGDLLSICDLEGDMNTANAFRESTGTCTRNFSGIIRKALSRNSKVTIERKIYKTGELK